MLNAQTLVLNAQANFATEKVQVQTIRGALKKTDIDYFSSLIPYTLTISSKQNLKAENALKIAKQKAAGSVVYVASDSVFSGYVSIEDALRPESAEAIQQLQGRGLETIMLSGVDILLHLAMRLKNQERKGDSD